MALISIKNSVMICLFCLAMNRGYLQEPAEIKLFCGVPGIGLSAYIIGAHKPLANSWTLPHTFSDGHDKSVWFWRTETMPIEVGEDKFYTVEELCQKFKISPVTVYGYIKAGKLPAKRFGKRYQISESVLGKFLKGAEDAVA